MEYDLYEFERLQKAARNSNKELERLNELYRGEVFKEKPMNGLLVRCNRWRKV